LAKLKVLIVGLNYAPEMTGIGKYTGEMAEWLLGQGHEVRVITVPPYYPQWRVQSPYKGYRYQKECFKGVTVYRCPLYVPRNVTPIQRLIHLLSFAISSFPLMLLQLFWRPAVIINPVPSLFSSPMCALIARLSEAKSILHIQDYEIDAMFGLGMANEGMVGKFARTFERMVLRSFDRVSTISLSMMKKAVQKGVKEDALLFFPNWSDTSLFDGAAPSGDMKERFGVPSDHKMILYSGNVGDKQGLEQVIEAADYFKSKPYHFVIVGDGSGKGKLQKLVQERALKNIAFSPLLELAELPSLLASADCHLVIQKKGVADAVLPSKLTNILAVGGNAVITAEPDTELGLLCNEYAGIAERVDPENVEALIIGIESALCAPTPNIIAMKYARENIDRDKVLSGFEQDLMKLI
tara:strand:- start:1521 stop:2747 length:1227 start_codon:yes stop_codon:yes gene_type:complete